MEFELQIFPFQPSIFTPGKRLRPGMPATVYRCFLSLSPPSAHPHSSTGPSAQARADRAKQRASCVRASRSHQARCCIAPSHSLAGELSQLFSWQTLRTLDTTDPTPHPTSLLTHSPSEQAPTRHRISCPVPFNSAIVILAGKSYNNAAK